MNEIEKFSICMLKSNFFLKQPVLSWSFVQLENPNVKDKGYAEVTIRYDEVALATSPSGTAHAIINVDRVRSTFLLGCQDSLIKTNASTTDYNVWKDLWHCFVIWRMRCGDLTFCLLSQPDKRAILVRLWSLSHRDCLRCHPCFTRLNRHRRLNFVGLCIDECPSCREKKYCKVFF